jgi:hypothetical protein
MPWRAQIPITPSVGIAGTLHEVEELLLLEVGLVVVALVPPGGTRPIWLSTCGSGKSKVTSIQLRRHGPLQKRRQGFPQFLVHGGPETEDGLKVTTGKWSSTGHVVVGGFVIPGGLIVVTMVLPPLVIVVTVGGFVVVGPIVVTPVEPPDVTVVMMTGSVVEVDVETGVVTTSSVGHGQGGGVMVLTTVFVVPVTLCTEFVTVKGGGRMLLVMEKDSVDARVSQTVTA